MRVNLEMLFQIQIKIGQSEEAQCIDTIVLKGGGHSFNLDFYLFGW